MHRFVIAASCLFLLALVIPAHAGSDADPAAEAPAGAGDRDAVMLSFVMGFLTTAQADATFRDACLEDLDQCLEAAGKAVPEGRSFDYRWDASNGHVAQFTEEGGTERVVHLSADGQFDSGLPKGFAARYTQDQFEKALVCCWTNQEGTYCRTPMACFHGAARCSSDYFSGIVDGGSNEIPCTW